MILLLLLEDFPLLLFASYLSGIESNSCRFDGITPYRSPSLVFDKVAFLSGAFH